MTDKKIDNSGGWIKMPRNIREHWLWWQPRKLQWWMSLVMMAQTGNGYTQMVGNIQVELKRGQLAMSVRKLAQIFACSKNTVVLFLRSLRQEGMIRMATAHKITIIQIEDFDQYCGPAPDYDPGDGFDPSAEEDEELKAQLRFIGRKNGKKSEKKGRKNMQKKCKKTPSKTTMMGQSLGQEQEIENIENISSSTSTPPIIPPEGDGQEVFQEVPEGNQGGRAGGASIQQNLDRLKGEAIALDALAKRMNTRPDVILRLADEFAAEQVVAEKTHTDYRDFKTHFLNWLRIRAERAAQAQNNAKTQQTPTQTPKNTRNHATDSRQRTNTRPDDRFANRRGTEPPRATAADYDAPL